MEEIMKKFFMVLGVIVLFLGVIPVVDVVSGYERCAGVSSTAYFIHDALFSLFGSVVVLLVRYIRYG